MTRPARWRVLYDAMVKLEPHELLHYEQMGELLGLDFIEKRNTIGLAAAKAAQQLARDGVVVMRLVRGYGYERANPGQVLDMVTAHQERSRREIDKAATKVDAVPVEDLDAGTARIFEVTRLGLSAQRQALAGFDMRNERRAAAVAAASKRLVAVPHTASQPPVERRSPAPAQGVTALAFQGEPQGV